MNFLENIILYHKMAQLTLIGLNDAGFVYDIAEGITCYSLCRKLCEAGGRHRQLCDFLPNTRLSYQLPW